MEEGFISLIDIQLEINLEHFIVQFNHHVFLDNLPIETCMTNTDIQYSPS